ncbi:sugar-binding transcriptional regulator [Qingshengfaniella alkalisoli]|uniref:Sugar-binding transcriptional regulator n=1 Tax=Qingshengfaniella alkalisoli TaxID=2599296 RepID=A0A5B8IAZ1_9RHOB|nr:sugar-binding transcriptional regulator [Qingshengfaniella alkalisoli]QDY70516.1 sugar-binding transcriptional regulator [Qingshengfaniella alkalisoli]
MVKARHMTEFENARMMHQALVMHFLEERAQKDIAEALGVSHATVNRLIKRGRQLGLVEIRIKSPVDHVVDLEASLQAIGGVGKVIVTPTVSEHPQTISNAVGLAAARYLIETMPDQGTLCLTGGKGVTSLVGAMEAQRKPIDIYPATGLVQGAHYTDVNFIAGQLAEKLGGRAYQIHAPLFAETPEIRDTLMGMNSVSAVFDRARAADVAVVGIGSILSEDSSYYDLHPLTETDRREIEASGAQSELLAHLLDVAGQPCGFALNDTLVGLSLDDFHRIPVRIGIASGAHKAAPILSVLRGGHLSTLVTDEATARKIIELAGEPS